MSSAYSIVGKLIATGKEIDMNQLTREAAKYINAQFEAGLINIAECTQMMLEIGVIWYYIKRDVR